MKHRDKREDFSSDEKFANFRSLVLENKESEVFFRSASATRNVYGRMEVVKTIIRGKSIKTIIDLTTIECNCLSNKFGQKLADQFRKILTEDGPYIIQCDAGKKHTGFASVVLEMLSGTNYEFIVQDYIESYVNNNGINVTNDCDTVERIKERINKIIRFIDGTEKNISEMDFASSAELYLSRCGFSEYEMLELRKKLKS